MNDKKIDLWAEYKQAFLKKSKPTAHHCSHNSFDSTKMPFVKISGIKDLQTALESTISGASFLTFAEGTDPTIIMEVRKSIDETMNQVFPDGESEDDEFDYGPKLVACISDDMQNPCALKYISLAEEGVIDFLQVSFSLRNKIFLHTPHFFSLEIKTKSDFNKVEKLLEDGEERVLLDVSPDLKSDMVKSYVSNLWLSGKINLNNATDVVKSLQPELIDINLPGEIKTDSLESDFLINLFQKIEEGCR